MADIEDSFLVTSLINYANNNCNGFPISKYIGNESLVVTTSKNTVSLFKLHETKPFRSWSSKQNQQFTCPVVFNNVSSHLNCVQNKQVLRQWTDDLDSIDLGSKFKFNDCIRQLLNLNDHEPIVIFENGDCVPLKYAIDNCEHKRKNVLSNGEKIISTKAVAGIEVITVFHLVASEQPGDLTFYCVSLSVQSGLVIDVVRTTLEKSNSTFRDWDLAITNDTPFLYTLWEDGEIRKHSVSSLEILSSLCKIKSNFNGNFLKIIDPTHALVASSKSEGFEVEIWDLKFRVCKMSKKFEICLRSSSHLYWENCCLFIQSSNHIHCIVVRIFSSLLSSSIGNNSSSDAIIPAKKLRWTSKIDGNMDTSEILNKSNVLSVFVTCKEELVKIIENNDVQGLMKCLGHYKDILEPQLVDMLKFLLELDEKFFDGIEVKVSYPNQFYSESRTSCILKLMSQPFNDVFLYQYLKKISTNDTLTLLKLLNFWVNENMLVYHHIDDILTLQEAITWINVLLDSHYNNFLLMKDAEIQTFLLHLNEMVNNFFQIYEDIEDTTHLIESIQKGKKLPQNCKKSSYHMELLIL